MYTRSPCLHLISMFITITSGHVVRASTGVGQDRVPRLWEWITAPLRVQVPGEVPQLVATGSVEDCNPDRVVLKRVVLTGYPVKVHKKKAAVRYMFFNPEDVKWFSPLEVWTKHGRRGRIKESLGTHGAMKCVFDSPVQQHDSVCLALYKRVFPKWPEDLTFNL